MVWRTWRTSPVPLQLEQRWGSAGLGASAATSAAAFVAGDLDFLFDAKDGLFEAQIQAILQVGAAAGSVAGAG